MSDMNLTVDKSRYAAGEDVENSKTGIFVRATIDDASCYTVDIYYLDRPSLMKWLRSRGGNNEWAENCVALLLGHR